MLCENKQTVIFPFLIISFGNMQLYVQADLKTESFVNVRWFGNFEIHSNTDEWIFEKRNQRTSTLGIKAEEQRCLFRKVSTSKPLC